jgi:ubiquitin-conjugating enzyme E2 O
MDLMRAVLLGPEGTPYHDGLFAFDFCFGSSYPAEPPKATYHSHGIRVNPNLYETGKVCLSLLATWAGKGTEVWDPKRSNMLQVLVSIQGLVLVDHPYYNEAGYEKHAGTEEGERNGGRYNEQAFLASAKTMLCVLRNPPRHFETLVRHHFEARGARILRACEAYLRGCPVGAYDGEDRGSTEPGVAPAPESAESSEAARAARRDRPPPSAGFKLALAKLVPKLRDAFERNARGGDEGEEAP